MNIKLKSNLWMICLVITLSITLTMMTTATNASQIPNRSVKVDKHYLQANIIKAKSYHAQYWTPISFSRLQNALNTANRLNSEWWAPQWKVSQASATLSNAIRLMYPAFRNITNGSNLSLPKWTNGQGASLNPANLTSAGANSQFIDSSYDQAVTVNAQSLTVSQSSELASYTVNLINKIRQQIGTSPLGVSSSSIFAAKQVAIGYEADNWSLWKLRAHDYNALNNALGQYQNVSGWSEDATAFGPSGSIFGTTMSSLKYQIFQSLYLMIFQDKAENYVHVKSLLGLGNVAPITGGNGCYLGLAFDNLGALHIVILHNDNLYNGKGKSIFNNQNILFTNVKTY